MYKPKSFDDTNILFLIPGAQNVNKYKNATIGCNTNIIAQTTAAPDANLTEWGVALMQPTAAYPCMFLDQPEEPDETGIMKFRYQIKILNKNTS